MKTEKKDLQLSLLYFKDACEKAGQSGLISCGIAQEIRETQTDETIFWLIENLVNKVEVKDLEQLKILSKFLIEKLEFELCGIINRETDRKKASVLSHIDFKQPSHRLNNV